MEYYYKNFKSILFDTWPILGNIHCILSVHCKVLKLSLDFIIPMLSRLPDTLGKCLYFLLCSRIDSLLFLLCSGVELLVRCREYDLLKDYTFMCYTDAVSSSRYVSFCRRKKLSVGLLVDSLVDLSVDSSVGLWVKVVVLVGVLRCGLSGELVDELVDEFMGECLWEASLQYSELSNVLHIPYLRSELLNCLFAHLLHGYHNASSSRAIYVGLFYKNRQSTNSVFSRHKNTTIITQTQRTILHGVWSVCNHTSLWFIPLSIVFFFTYYSLVLKALPIPKSTCAYFLFGSMVYLMLSGFVFFLKKYRYRLYTSVVQRFWRRAITVFWLVEGSLFVCFVYLIFNTSREPYYMYDNPGIHKTHFFSWRLFLLKNSFCSILMVCTGNSIYNLKWNMFNKVNHSIILVTLSLIYVVWVEVYQFFHLVCLFNTHYWLHNSEERLWDLTLEHTCTHRSVVNYVAVCMVAKFWHVVFVAIFWSFSLLRFLESSRCTFSLLTANLHNFIFIYFLGWFCMYPWFKFVLRRGLDLPFFWFLVSNRRAGIFIFFNDLKLHTTHNLHLLYVSFCLPHMKCNRSGSYFYWYPSTNSSMPQFRKHSLRDIFIRCLEAPEIHENGNVWYCRRYFKFVYCLLVVCLCHYLATLISKCKFKLHYKNLKAVLLIILRRFMIFVTPGLTAIGNSMEKRVLQFIKFMDSSCI